jgi:chorismate mutase
MENKDTLNYLRNNIDEIDRKIFDLIQERLKFVSKVGELKKSSDSQKYIIRPGREALKVMKAYQMSVEAGYNSKISKAIANIWREMISLSINLEEPAIISLDKNNKDLYYLVREYMGSYSEVKHLNSEDEALTSLIDGKSNIAAVEVFKENNQLPWWVSIANHSQLCVFAKLPLFDEPKFGNKMLISNLVAEPCGNDIYLYVLSKKLPDDEKDSFNIISTYKNYSLATTDEFYNKYQSKLDAKYIGCYAVLRD